MRRAAAVDYNRGMAVIDTELEFDTLAYVRMLRAVGVEEKQAEAHAEAARATRAGLATKADLATLRAEIRADLYRALWIQTGAIVGTIIAAAGVIAAIA